MDVNPDREEFRQYLADTGVVKALSRALMRLYELKYNRPEAAIVFIIKNLTDDLPSLTEYENLLNELNTTKFVLETIKKNGKLSASELAMINNIQLSMPTLNVDALIDPQQVSNVKGGNETLNANQQLGSSLDPTGKGSKNKTLNANQQQVPDGSLDPKVRGSGNKQQPVAGSPLDSKTQQPLANDSLISARQSQIMKGNQSKTSSDNKSKLGKWSKTDSNYAKSIEKAIKELELNPKCESLLKKHLKLDMYNNLKNEKTSSGADLFDCIRSGLEIHESMVGVYAFDSEAYDIFAELFDPLIEDYHGFTKVDTHPAPDWGSPNTFTNVDPKKEFITSTRIRCIRTVDKFPLIPSMTEPEFKDLCTKLKDVLGQLSGEASGTFYELDKMDAQTKSDMIKNRYILEYGDRFLEAAGATEFWPTGRAVFLNDKKTFFVWVNEEDHLRFISMEGGSDFCSVYTRLKVAVEQCSKTLKFAMHNRFGYITLCPSNLGNTIRASVMIKLPKLAKQYKIKDVAEKLNLEIRNQGQGSAQGDMFEISNKRKLGLTEYASIKQLHDGIIEIIKMEKSL